MEAYTLAQYNTPDPGQSTEMNPSTAQATPPVLPPMGNQSEFILGAVFFTLVVIAIAVTVLRFMPRLNRRVPSAGVRA